MAVLFAAENMQVHCMVITKLGDILPYEQPTKYIVESTKYDNSYKTPVLTAGKSFLLGYTNEEEGIYTNLPCIIFDDFTTASKYVNFPFKVKSSAMKILTAKNDDINLKYYYYLMQIIHIDSQTHKRFWISEYAKYEVSLPPLAEQEKIVLKIEELFSELDKGIEELEQAKARLKVYRQSVLKNAFEGKFTEIWRKENNCRVENDFYTVYKQNSVIFKEKADESRLLLSIPREWKLIKLGEIFDVEVGATPSRKEDKYWHGDINWVASGEVKFCKINQSKEKISELGLNNTSTSLHPIGTVLLAMIGEGKTRGQAAILNIPAAHNQNTAAIIVPNTPCSSEYLYYFLYMNYEYTRRLGSGNNQKALNKTRVQMMDFPFTSFEEQKQIVEQIESKLSICDNIEQTITDSLKKAESLRQSILKKAFNGELV